MTRENASETTADVYDERRCRLGEGPFWHPELAQLFWFDILGQRILTRGPDGPREWAVGAAVSAGGWLDAETLLIATEIGLERFGLADGQRALVAEIEADRPETRSNDGKTDPWGGFWVSTMSKTEAPDQGHLYRYYKGRVRRLFGPLSIGNALAFAPGGACVYFSDTPRRRIWRWSLAAADGWPEGEPELFLEGDAIGFNPDGGICDADGTLWVAGWGAGRVTGFSPEGREVGRVPCAASQVTCPAFGGPDLKTLYMTSAIAGSPDDDGVEESAAGMTFAQRMDVVGAYDNKAEL